MNYRTYIKNKEAHQLASYHISKGKSWIEYEGKTYTELEFDRLFDLSQPLKMDAGQHEHWHENADGTKRWLY